MKYKLILHSYITAAREVYALDYDHAKALKSHYTKQGFKVEAVIL